MAKKKVTTTTTTVTVETIDDTKKNFHAHILIDNSGSMSGWEDKVVSGINEYVTSLKNEAAKDGVKTTVSISLFSTGYYSMALGGIANAANLVTLREKIDVKEFKAVERPEIVPNGGTPLYDAIGKMFDMTPSNSDTNYAYVILTDGEENSSRQYNREQIKAAINAKQESGSAVIYLGANQDAWHAGGGMGVQRGFTASYSMANIGEAFAAASTSSMRYRSSGSAVNAAFTAGELASMSGGPTGKTDGSAGDSKETAKK